jgi:hypothetical protein
MFDKSSSLLLWVSPDAIGGNGTFDNPFCDIESALKKAVPGSTIVLQSGNYNDDLTIQISGLIDKPVRITSDENANVTVNGGCWYLYDSSDIIIEKIHFVNARTSALSVTGKSARNIFTHLSFTNCGQVSKETCTVYFGGSGIENNMIAESTFTRDIKDSFNVSIAVMVSTSGHSSTNPVRQHIFKRNTVQGYSHAFIAGSSDKEEEFGGHFILENTVRSCSSDAIIIKSSDSAVGNNQISDCPVSAVRIRSGQSVTVFNNRIVNCGTGIVVNGSGQSINGNCIINSLSEAIRICDQKDDLTAAAENIIVMSNTFVKTSGSSSSSIICESHTSSVIIENLFDGYNVNNFDSYKNSKSIVTSIVSNATTQNGFSGNDFISVDPQFTSEKDFNFESSSEKGAHGWVATGGTPPIETVESHEHYSHEDEPGNNLPDDETLKKDNEIISAFFQNESDDFFDEYDDDFVDDNENYHDDDKSFHERDDV